MTKPDFCCDIQEKRLTETGGGGASSYHTVDYFYKIPVISLYDFQRDTAAAQTSTRFTKPNGRQCLLLQQQPIRLSAVLPDSTIILHVT